MIEEQTVTFSSNPKGHLLSLYIYNLYTNINIYTHTYNLYTI